jgi:hypothetical protein
VLEIDRDWADCRGEKEVHRHRTGFILRRSRLWPAVLGAAIMCICERMCRRDRPGGSGRARKGGEKEPSKSLQTVVHLYITIAALPVVQLLW